MTALPLLLLLAWAGWRAGRAVLRSLATLPRSNDDLVFF